MPKITLYFGQNWLRTHSTELHGLAGKPKKAMVVVQPDITIM